MGVSGKRWDGVEEIWLRLSSVLRWRGGAGRTVRAESGW